MIVDIESKDNDSFNHNAQENDMWMVKTLKLVLKSLLLTKMALKFALYLVVIDPILIQ